MFTHDVETNGRRLAKLVRDLLRTEPCDSLADLTGALKDRCARLHIRWTNDDITDAYRLIGSNTPLPGDRPRPRRRVEREPDPVIIGRDEAARIYAWLVEQAPR